MNGKITEFLIQPSPADPQLTKTVSGLDQAGNNLELKVIEERAITLFLNSQEVVTVMTIGDHPDLLALGYLKNQNMLSADNPVTEIEYDEDISVVVVRTENPTSFEKKLDKKIKTSGCAQGTVFGDIMDTFESTELPKSARIKSSWLYELTRKINTTPSLYLEAGAIHGCVLCEEDRPLVYMEDVGRHNAVDKIAGWMEKNTVSPENKIFYTTGRLTSEMVIKTVLMGIPILVSRSGFTAYGVELARQAGLTLVGRARGKRFMVLSGEHRVLLDADPEKAPVDDSSSNRKAASDA